MRQSQVIVIGFQLHKGHQQLLLDRLPDDPGHLVASISTSGVRISIFFIIHQPSRAAGKSGAYKSAARRLTANAICRYYSIKGGTAQGGGGKSSLLPPPFLKLAHLRGGEAQRVPPFPPRGGKGQPGVPPGHTRKGGAFLWWIAFRKAARRALYSPLRPYRVRGLPLFSWISSRGRQTVAGRPFAQRIPVFKSRLPSCSRYARSSANARSFKASYRVISFIQRFPARTAAAPCFSPAPRAPSRTAGAADGEAAPRPQPSLIRAFLSNRLLPAPTTPLRWPIHKRRSLPAISPRYATAIHQSEAPLGLVGCPAVKSSGAQPSTFPARRKSTGAP